MKIMRFLHLGWRVFLAGGNANNSSKAGSFTLNANNTWSNDNVNISSHLCLLCNKILNKCKDLASWQKTKKSLIQVLATIRKINKYYSLT
jgi:hypothetical protein